MTLKNVIIASCILISLYVLIIFLSLTTLALWMVSISPLIVAGLVYRVLKDPNPSPNTFEDRFYEDYDYPRNR